MPIIAAHVRIDASTERVWDVLADFGGVHRTNPGVSASHLTSEESSGVGATRHCDLSFSGAATEERIVRWDEGRGLGIDIYDGKRLPFSKAEAEFTIEPDGEGSVLEATMACEMKYGPLGQVMDAVMVRRQYLKGWGQFIAGVKHHAESGDEVTADTPLDRGSVTLTVT